MAKGVQNWPLNLHRTAFDPLFGKNLVENWQNPVFDRFF